MSADVPLPQSPSAFPRLRPGSWVLLVCLLAPALGHAGRLPPVPDVLKELRAIESASLRGEVEPLRTRYTAEVKANPNDVMAQVYLAWCEMPADAAWDGLKRVSSLYPEVPWPHYGMGRIYLRWKVRDQAEHAFRTALVDDKNFYPGQVGLADVLRASGKLAEAEARYREVLSQQDDAQARAGLGLALLAEGKTADAQAQLSQALDQWPDQPEALIALSDLSRQANDLRAALRYAGKVTQIAPRYKAARRMVADLQYTLGEKDLAAAQYDILVRQGENDPSVLSRLEELYTELHNTEGLERVLKLRTARGGGVEDMLELAKMAESRGAFEEADKRLSQALSVGPHRVDVLLRIGHVKLQRKQPIEALEAYRAAREAGAHPEELAEEAELVRRFKLPTTPISGTVEQIYNRVFAGVNALYTERLKENPVLGGFLKVQVRVDAKGKVLEVELLEDTVKDALIAGHVYFALKDAVYPKKRRDPVFEFRLEPPLIQGGR